MFGVRNVRCVADSFGAGPKTPKSRVAGRGLLELFLGRPLFNFSVMFVNSQLSASRQLGFLNLSCLVGKFLSFGLRDKPVKASSFARDTLPKQASLLAGCKQQYLNIFFLNIL